MTMTKNTDSGNVPHKTIDHNGNIVDKPYGLGRWARVRVYTCTHTDCTNSAVTLRTSPTAHNCCGIHEEGAVQ